MDVGGARIDYSMISRGAADQTGPPRDEIAARPRGSDPACLARRRRSRQVSRKYGTIRNLV